MPKYTVITGDVIKSRNYQEFNDVFHDSLNKIKYPKNNIAPFTISREDEI